VGPLVVGPLVVGPLVVGPTVGQVNVPALLLTMYLPEELFFWHLVRSNLSMILLIPLLLLHPTFNSAGVARLPFSIPQLGVPEKGEPLAVVSIKFGKVPVVVLATDTIDLLPSV